MKKKKLLSVILLLTIALQIITPVVSVYANSKAETVTDNSDVVVLNEVVSLTSDYIIINEVAYNQIEFEELINSSIYIQPRFAAAAGVYFVPGVGQVALTATGAVILAGAVIYAGHWAWNTISNFLHAPKWSVARNYGIDHWMLYSNGNVDLGQFKDKNGRTPLNKNSGTFKNGRYTVEKDTTGHGGRRWKLKKDGRRVGSLDGNGNIISK